MIRMPSVRGVLRVTWPVAVTGAVVASLAGHGGKAAAAPAPDLTVPAADTVSYKEDVLPIFQKRCARCHGAENEEGEVVAEVSLIVINYERLMMGS
ncbi:MAG: hypothetical protein OXF01_15525, partial [Gemmatimonadetes bacterium]|nr:hypothetical protein [Gemmatimonadota bacterium]